MSVYRVKGRLAYRDHEHDDVFEAVLDHDAERRAIARGAIELLQRSTPMLQPETFSTPDGWGSTPLREGATDGR